MSESSEGDGGDGNSSGQTVNSSIDSQQQEEQQERSRRTVYKTTDLDVFNLLQRPVWVCLCGEEWGDEKRLLWGNTATVEMWNAPSLQAVLARDFNVDMSEAVKQRYHNVARKCQAGEVFSQQVSRRSCSSSSIDVHTCRGRMHVIMEASIPPSTNPCCMLLFITHARTLEQ